MLFHLGCGSGDWWWSRQLHRRLLAGRVAVDAIDGRVPVTPPVGRRRGPNAIT